MTSSSQFIDYFVHDILDYTVLTNEQSDFKPNFEVFNIKESFNHVEKILKDQAHMKGIKVKTIFENFEEHNNKLGQPYLVKADQKRMQ